MKGIAISPGDWPAPAVYPAPGVEAPVEKAELAYTADTGRWRDRRWEVAPARLAAGRVEADVPAGARVCYFHLHDARGAVASTEHDAA